MIRARARALWQRGEALLDLTCGTFGNPLRHLGALGLLLLWVLAASGIWLYAAIDTSAGGAWRSIDALSRQQWHAGGVLRSLHRYAADAFVVVPLLHLLREWLYGRHSGFRRWSWLSGVPLLPLAFVCGIGGFWLNWDRLGQYSATATAEWLDALPLFATPLARNFLSQDAVGDRLFSLFVFIHLGVPLLLLFVHPLADAISAAGLWVALSGLLLVLLLLPWWPHRAVPVAQVDPAHCSGCRRCFDDCPYAAITMVPHPAGRGELARVDAARCASCGICAGACPSATPFRSIERLTSGIDMPQLPIDALRRWLQQGLAQRGGAARYVVFGCARGARVEALAAPDVLTSNLLCSAMLPPSFIDYALSTGAAGVVLASCAGCEFRLGPRWLEQRLAGQREPRLRASVARARVQHVQADAGSEAMLLVALDRLRRAAPANAAPDTAAALP